MWLSNTNIHPLIPIYAAATPVTSTFVTTHHQVEVNTNSLNTPTPLTLYRFFFEPRFQNTLLSNFNSSARIIRVFDSSTDYESAVIDSLDKTSQYLVPFHFYYTLDINPLYVFNTQPVDLKATIQFTLSNIETTTDIKIFTNCPNLEGMYLKQTTGDGFNPVSSSFLDQYHFNSSSEVRFHLTYDIYKTSKEACSLFNYRVAVTSRDVLAFDNPSNNDIEVLYHQGNPYTRHMDFNNLSSPGFIMNNNVIYLVV